MLESKALALLAMREYGDLELMQKLAQKCPEATRDEIAEVLLKCQTQNWQSDQRYVDAFVAFSCAKGHGPYKIRHALEPRTSHSDLVNAALDIDEEEWIEMASQVLAKKYGEGDAAHSAKEQASRMRFLQSRGFSQSQIWKAFKSR